ncbi:3-oxoadipate enol-lactonase [Flavisphingomonas formosensis]|uniref:3-oxoadipate enol-lactonase n=1 Tax=Flavisphingomonas formosensis TaxID=861534 RepID=UPI0012F978D0|nr:3-oxoadipate enol-lactonase [Sphingomonas formosensis]
MTDTILTGDGCRIAYRFDGPADAPVLLLSNSLGTAMAMWEPQMAALTRDFCVLRYDSRGHGASDAPTGAYSIDRLGRDVVELLDALAIDRVTFCGLSKGGMVGQWMGLRASERLDRLILCNTSSYMGPPSGWDARIRTVLADGMAAMTDAVLERWFTPEFQERAPDAVAPVRAMLLATRPHGYAGCCAAIRDMDMRRYLPLIATPTLVIAGSHDPATPLDHSEALVEGIPDASLIVLPAAHLSSVECASEFTEAVRVFRWHNPVRRVVACH